MRRISSAREGAASTGSLGAGTCADALGTATETIAVAGGATLSTGGAKDAAIEAVTGAVAVVAAGGMGGIAVPDPVDFGPAKAK